MLHLLSEYKEQLGGGASGLIVAIVTMKMSLKSAIKDIERIETKLQTEIKEIKDYVDKRHEEVKEQMRELKDITRSGFDKVFDRLYDLNKKSNDAQK